MNISREHLRRTILVSSDVIIIIASFLLALNVASSDFSEIHYRWFEYVWMLAVLIGIKFFIFFQTGLYREIVRFASLDFAVKIVKSTIFGSLAAITAMHLVRREIDLPVLLVDWMASCILIGFSRFGWRYMKEGRFARREGRNTLLYGAGEHGAAVARHLLLNDHLGHHVVGFIDDSPEKADKIIQGRPVLGTLQDLSKIMRTYEVEEMVISFSNPDGELVKRVFHACREHGVRCRIVPGMSDLLTGTEVVRNIDMADLMRRPPRELDREMIGAFLKGSRVMVTGAGGSIGSEIFRQVLGFQPEAIAALDHSEFALYKLDEELSHHPLKTRCHFSLIDMKCEELIEESIRTFRPDVIFHAAAYKHVPILEQDIKAAVRNNVQGLLNILHAAEQHQVKKFIFISTDKAVRPTNIMGATKRIGERLVQRANRPSGMRCMAVRFGNVLASSGSVVPKFISQIRAGGPVTVTHPDVTRYFMLIPEAVELVLQAASMGEGGETFVLDMGTPVRIREMAEDLISLMGHIPHVGISIVYTGLRPGEKLHEELFLGDVERTTRFQDISVSRTEMIDFTAFEDDLNRLLKLAASSGGIEGVRALIAQLVPEYTAVRQGSVDESCKFGLRDRTCNEANPMTFS